MRIGIVFHKNPFVPPSGIDYVRLRAISRGLILRGIHTEIIAPVERKGIIDEIIPVRNLDALNQSSRYDLIKTSYHDSILLIDGYKGPVISRIVRVVDESLPERDEPSRRKLLKCQESIKIRARALVLNNSLNEKRWRLFYGSEPPISLIPTGCPTKIPQPKGNPYLGSRPVILFLGSLAAPRMVEMINGAARALHPKCEIHFIGLNKAYMYGGRAECRLEPTIVDHGQIPEDLIWDYIRYAKIGLALATGPHSFDNDMSKIFNYLRGGLPVLSEEPIINNDLILQKNFGKVFRFGDLSDLVTKAMELLETSFESRKSEIMDFMASEHSWDRRVDAYIDLFVRILNHYS